MEQTLTALACSVSDNHLAGGHLISTLLSGDTAAVQLQYTDCAIRNNIKTAQCLPVHSVSALNPLLSLFYCVHYLTDYLFICFLAEIDEDRLPNQLYKVI